MFFMRPALICGYLVNPHTFTGVALSVSRLREERIITFIHGFTAVAFCKGVGVKIMKSKGSRFFIQALLCIGICPVSAVCEGKSRSGLCGKMA